MLVQRERQLVRLIDAFTASRDNAQGHVALITGAVGSGKTALLETFADHVHQRRGRVLRAVASATESDLPFGVVGQLFHDSRPTDDSVRRVGELLVPRMRERPMPEPRDTDPTGTADPEWAPVLHSILTALLELTESGPVVLAVDDVHHADRASLHCLLYIVRRVRYAPVMVVLTEAAMLRPALPSFRAELLSQPSFSRVSLPPLSGDELVRLAGDRLGTAGDDLAEEALSLTGGSPLLARALIDDDQPEHRQDAFDQAVLACLYRHEESVRQVAYALAVLDRPATPEILGRMLGVVPDLARRSLMLLHTAGLGDRDRLRHRRIQRAVLAHLPADELACLHRRAAEALHDYAANPEVIAQHLLSADRVEGDWTVPVLREAAAIHLSSGRPDVASACLRLAKQEVRSGQQPAAVCALLVRARWQANPLAAGPHLHGLLNAGPSEPVGQRAVAVPYLIWQGRLDEAAALLREAEQADAGPDRAGPDAVGPDGAGMDPRLLRMLLDLTDPGVPDRVSPEPDKPLVGTPGTVMEAVAVLAQALHQNAGDAGPLAEELFQRRHIGDDGPATLSAPLVALLVSGRADRTASWIDLMLDDPAASRAPSWLAILQAIRAEAALRLGDLRGAEHHARAALEVSPLAWGIALGGPLATLIRCATEAGRLHEANRWVAHATPAGLMRTPFGPMFLAARARFLLQSGRPQAAQNDLYRCGDLLRAWQMDVSGLVPWRLELARVHLSLRQGDQVARLLRQQLEVAPQEDTRTRGRATRLLALTAPAGQRPALLEEAVDLLRLSNDRLELARALGDNGQALLHSGDLVGARAALRQAYRLAHDCGATALAKRLLSVRVGGALGGSDDAGPFSDDQLRLAQPGGADPLITLSQAERKVAALAAQGHTNRQISDRLFIAMSTVEGHLTRVYRKLAVKRRSDLSANSTLLTEPGADIPSVRTS
ncbi:AAA family ATPase [Micromonospora sp. NPDC048898]|uniref:AAA family ATPase n=1 Tax=Micromonospora sp. NPDC048898 TaxID=3364260 RepID=UPI003719EA6F